MHSGYLQEIVILLLAAIVIVAIFKRLRLSPVLGYLVAGALLGDYGMGIIHSSESTHYIAEFGIVFLLFAIGLELTFDRLKSMRMAVFGIGTAQLALTSAIFIGVAHWLGASMQAAIVIGGGLALSSTAVVLQVLAERGEQATQAGRIALAVLILQDLAVVPLLIMVPLLGKSDTSVVDVVFHSMFEAFVVLTLIMFFGRRILRPIYQAIGSLHNHELFVATTLLVVLGSAWVTSAAGLSLALGAFVAGLLVAETEFRPQVESDIEPFKGLLLGLFFITIGMSIDLTMLYNKIGMILFLTILLILMKTFIIVLLMRAFRFRFSTALHSGLLLSQGGEFAFILFNLAAEQGILENDFMHLMLVVVSISMAITPLLAALGRKISDRAISRDPIYLNYRDIQQETADLENHIIIAGFGRVGKTIGQVLTAREIGNYIALDSDPKNVHDGRKEGLPVYYGHADRIDTLRSLGIERAKLIAISVRDRQATKRAVQTVHQAWPDLPIIVRAWDRNHAHILREAGATVALAEAFESSLLLASSILTTTGLPESEVQYIIEQFRSDTCPLSHSQATLQELNENASAPPSESNTS